MICCQGVMSNGSLVIIPSATQKIHLASYVEGYLSMKNGKNARGMFMQIKPQMVILHGINFYGKEHK